MIAVRKQPAPTCIIVNDRAVQKHGFVRVISADIIKSVMFEMNLQTIYEYGKTVSQ